MKKVIFLALFVSSSAFAQFLYPHVSNTGNGAMITVSNGTVFNFSCNGPIYLRLDSGETESHYFHEFIYGHRFVTRNVFPRNRSERVSFVNHSIFCNRI